MHALAKGYPAIRVMPGILFVGDQERRQTGEEREDEANTCN